MLLRSQKAKNTSMLVGASQKSRAERLRILCSNCTICTAH